MAAKKRHGARRLVMQALYQAQITGHDSAELLNQFVKDIDYPRIDSEYFAVLLNEACASREELDRMIGEYGDIPPEQLDPVEHAVLWVALTELQGHHEVPVRVVINEAIELTKTFGAEGGHRYVNGLLDKASTTLRPAGL